MLWKIAGFEYRYQVRTPAFWVSCGLFFIFAFLTLAIDQIHVGGDNGNIHRNAPYSLASIALSFGLFFMFASTGMAAATVARDDETGFGPILRSTPVQRLEFLYGRGLGAFAAVVTAFLSVPLGMALGAAAPWLDHEVIGPFRPGDYLAATFGLALPLLFLTFSLFFALAAATRSMISTYIGMIGLLVAWTVANALTDKPEWEHFMALAEPFGLGAFSYVTKYWTVLEKNTLAPPLGGVMLVHSLIWTPVAVGLWAVAGIVFRFETKPVKPAKAEQALVADARKSQPTLQLKPPSPATVFWAQMVARTRLDLAQVFKSPAFFILLGLGALNAGAGLWFSNGPYETDVYPVTRRVIATLQGAFTFIPILVAVFYAGELVWKERERRTDELIDSTPAPDVVFAAPKILAISLVLIIILTVGALIGVGVQLAKGWTDLQLRDYFSWYIAPSALLAIQIAILAVFVQALAPSKYVGFGIMLVWFVFSLVARSLHFEDHLYRYATSLAVPLSDMNGEGHFGAARGWFQAYWSLIALILAGLTYGLWRRGRDAALRPRLRRLPRRLRSATGLGLVGLAVMAAGVGGFIFYNTHHLNTYRTDYDAEVWLAGYEKTLLPFEKTPQPKITDVRLAVDLYPSAQRAVAHGVFRMQNRTGQPLREVHLRFAQDVKVVSLSVEGARPKQTFDRFNYRIFAFDTPLSPGETRSLSFEVERGQRGFRNDDNGWTRVYDNGTFLDSGDITPSLGIGREGLLQDRAIRRKHGLPDALRPAKLEDEGARGFNLLGKDADWVNADITVSTTADQTPMAPGYKVSDQTLGGRRIAEFRTEAPILKFFSIQSARYAERAETYKGIDLHIFYHPDHGWNVDRMIKALKVGLDYDQANFSPYQFRQVRILEFPGYADFAQSFANTIPYSENLGWIFDSRDPEKIDMVTYVTAHELGHQWWAHQVIGADLQGASMLDETLAQYSALMAMEKLYGHNQIRKFLKFELDRYLRARGGDLVEEEPLNRVENQAYIHYRKGSLIMYRLKEELGEARVNAALRTFLHDFAFKGPPYPTTRDLIADFRAQARPDQQNLITDLFEKITLYDLKAISAKTRHQKDGAYATDFTFEAHKLYADGKGLETEKPLNDTVDLGLFRKEPGSPGFGDADVLSLRRYPIHSGRQTITLVSATKPAHAGVDPYAILIDRKTDDNLVAVH